jgi:hypothetical protein
VSLQGAVLLPEVPEIVPPVDTVRKVPPFAAHEAIALLISVGVRQPVPNELKDFPTQS